MTDAVERFSIATDLLDLFRRAGIACAVLHGMEGGEVGRDLDVWISRRDWPRTSATVMAFGRARAWNPVRTLGPFGLRFLFFTNPAACGTLELHCVRDLDWFYVRRPDEIQSLHPYKRFFMTLATGQLDKVRRELGREPLSGDEKTRLGDFLVRRGIFGRNELASFWADIESGLLDKASRCLRRTLFSQAPFHPFSVARFVLKRIVKVFWMFAKPAGVCLFCASGADDLVDVVESQKGVLVRVESHDLRRFGFLRSLISFVALRFAQGHQVASIVSIRPGQRPLTHLVFRSAFYEAGSDPISCLADLLRTVLAARSNQCEGCFGIAVSKSCRSDLRSMVIFEQSASGNSEVKNGRMPG